MLQTKTASGRQFRPSAFHITLYARGLQGTHETEPVEKFCVLMEKPRGEQGYRLQLLKIFR